MAKLTISPADSFQPSDKTYASQRSPCPICFPRTDCSISSANFPMALPSVSSYHISSILFSMLIDYIDIGVITQFICDQLQTKCKAGQDAVTACAQGQLAAKKQNGQAAGMLFDQSHRLWSPQKEHTK